MWKEKGRKLGHRQKGGGRTPGNPLSDLAGGFPAFQMCMCITVCHADLNVIVASQLCILVVRTMAAQVTQSRG